MSSTPLEELVQSVEKVRYFPTLIVRLKDYPEVEVHVIIQDPDNTRVFPVSLSGQLADVKAVADLLTDIHETRSDEFYEYIADQARKLF